MKRMKTIYKYSFEINDVVELKMPKGAQLLSVQDQEGTACAWALIDPSEELVNFKLRIFGTGHPIPEEELVNLEYFVTFQMFYDRGNLVWHIFTYKEKN